MCRLACAYSVRVHGVGGMCTICYVSAYIRYQLGEMMTTMNSRPSMIRALSFLKIAAIFSGVFFVGSAQALRFEPADELSIDLDTTLAYGAMWRMESPDKNLLYPVMPLNSDTPTNMIADPKFTDQVTAWNGDDGDRNFKKGDQVSDRYAVTSDMDLRYKKYGLFLRAQMYYDSVYFGNTSWTSEGADTWGKSVTGCGSILNAPVGGNPCGYMGPESINNLMADGEITNPSHFSDRVKASQGYKARFLDSYIYGTFPIGDHTLDLRLGRQALAWGEALFLQGGIGFAQNRFDAAAATSPGVELKEIFLPTGRLYGQIDLTDTVTMEAYWQYEWLPAELFSTGSYFGQEDITTSNILLTNSNGIGTGAPCMFGLTEQFDPVGPKSCGDESNAGWGGPTFNTGPGGPGLNKADGIGTMHWLQTNKNYMSRAPDKEPDAKSDQYGLAFRKLLEGGSEAGIYFVQYHDTLPTVWASNNGGVEYLHSPLINCATSPNGAGTDPYCDPNYHGPTMDSSNVEGFNGNKYTIAYQERIKLFGLTYNTVIDDIQFGFELAYRKNQPVVTGCSRAQIDASTFDPALASAVVDQASLAAAGASIHTDCKDDSLKYYAMTGGYDFQGGTGWDVNTSSKLAAWPKPAEVFTYNIGMTMVLPSLPVWDTAFLVGEIGGFYVGSGFQDQDLKVSTIGSFTKQGDGISFIFMPQYKNVAEGVDLTIPFFVNYTIDGSFAYFNYNEKALWYSIGAEAVYLSSTRVGIYYNAYSGANNPWKDRDNISVTAKYTF